MKPKTRDEVVANAEQKHADLLASINISPVQDAELKTHDAQAQRKTARPNRERKSPDRGQLPATVEILTPAMVMRRAFEKGDLDLAERMLAFQRQVDAIMAEKAYGDALCAVEAEVKAILRNRKNPQTGSTYSTLPQMDRIVRPVASHHGFSLSFSQGIGENAAPAGAVRLICTVRAKGHKELHHLDIPCDGKGAKGNDVMTKTHALGSALTYGRRYQLAMIFNLITEDDDDGNAAGGKPPPPIETRSRATINAEQVQEAKAALERCGVSEAQACRIYRVKSITDLPVDEFPGLMQRCKAKAEENARQK